MSDESTIERYKALILEGEKAVEILTKERDEARLQRKELLEESAKKEAQLNAELSVLRDTCEACPTCKDKVSKTSS